MEASTDTELASWRIFGVATPTRATTSIRALSRLGGLPGRGGTGRDVQRLDADGGQHRHRAVLVAHLWRGDPNKGYYQHPRPADVWLLRALLRASVWIKACACALGSELCTVVRRPHKEHGAGNARGPTGARGSISGPVWRANNQGAPPGHQDTSPSAHGAARRRKDMSPPAHGPALGLFGSKDQQCN